MVLAQVPVSGDGWPAGHSEWGPPSALGVSGSQELVLSLSLMIGREVLASGRAGGPSWGPGPVAGYGSGDWGCPGGLPEAGLWLPVQGTMYGPPPTQLGWQLCRGIGDWSGCPPPALRLHRVSRPQSPRLNTGSLSPPSFLSTLSPWPGFVPDRPGPPVSSDADPAHSQVMLPCPQGDTWIPRARDAWDPL